MKNTMTKEMKNAIELAVKKTKLVAAYNLATVLNPSDEKVEMVTRSAGFYKSIDRFEEAKLVFDYFYNPFAREIKQVVYYQGERTVNYYSVRGFFTESRFEDTINEMSQHFIQVTSGLPRITAGGYLKFNPRNAVF
ncbi:hypothetical protein ABEX78_32250 [Priestia megaterium]